MLSAMPRGRDGRVSTGSGQWIHLSAGKTSNHSCKTLPPLEAIKGEPRLMAKGGPHEQVQPRHTHTSQFHASSLVE